MFGFTATNRFFLYAAMLVIGSPVGNVRSELLMDTHGYVSFSPYVAGVREINGLYPGYRAEFLAHVDVVRWRNFIFTGLVGNHTMISRSDASIFQMDRIRYILAPGVRYDGGSWIMRASWFHESVYALSRAEDEGGAAWHNSIRLGVGTKGAYYLYLRERLRQKGDGFLNVFDAQVNLGVFLRGSESIWVAKNNDYQYEESSLLRYQIASFYGWLYFVSLSQQLWINLDNNVEQKLDVRLNAMKKGSVSLFGWYFIYTFYDTYTADNEDGLGALGLRIIF